MTFQGPFSAVMAGIILEKSNQVHQDLSSFFGTTSYTFYYDQFMFMNKTNVEGLQNICLFPYCYLFKDHCQKTHDNHIQKISNFFKLIFFNDFSRQNVIFLGQHEIPWLFRARLNFHDFSRLVWTMCPIIRSKTDWGMAPPPWRGWMIHGPRWWYLGKKCLLNSHLAFFYITILSISPLQYTVFDFNFSWHSSESENILTSK